MELPHFPPVEIDTGKFRADAAELVDKVTEFVRNAAYAAIGLGAVIADELQERNDELTKRVNEFTSRLGETINHEIVPGVQSVLRTTEQQLRDLVNR